MKISTKITLTIFWGALITIVSIIFFVYTSTRSSLEEIIGFQQLELSKQKINEVTLFLSQRNGDIQVFTTFDRVRNAAITRTYTGLAEEPALLEARKSLVDAANIYGEWKLLHLFDRTGNIITTTGTGASIQNISTMDQTYIDQFNETVKGNVTHSEAFYSKELDQTTMVFMAPVRTSIPDGEVVGVVAGYIDWEAIMGLLSDVTEFFTHIYDSTGTMIATNTSQHTKTLLQANYSDYPAIKSAMSGEASSQVMKSISGDYFSVVSYMPQTEYNNYKGNGWILIMDVPVTVAYTAAYKTATKIAAVAVPTILATSFAILFLISTLLYKPMRTLLEAVTAISQGDLTRQIKVRSKDEIGVLAGAFNNMTTQLREIWHTLEQKVTERTAALANTLHDVEERNNWLEEAKKKDEALLESIGDGVIATDESGKVLVINKAAQEQLGWKADEIVGKSVVNSIPLEDENGKLVSPQDRPIHKALKYGKKITNTGLGADALYYIRRDRTKFPIMLSASPVILNKKIFGTIIVFRDVTKEKEIDRMKSEFISLASHQLRTPLSTVNWYTEILLEGDAGHLTDDQKKYLDEIYKANRRMVDLVNALLNVSRIEMGTFLIEPKPTFLPEISKNVIAEVQPQINMKKLKVEEKYDPNIPVIQADPRITTIIFQNLITNAVKYTSDGGNITIEVSMQPEENSVLIKVSDTGYGIPQHQQDRIFTKLFRADNVTQKETEGTGLGLYIIKNILEYTGGSIWFESEENKGTTFFVTMPVQGMQKKEGSKALS
ncbi:hypothetical protein A2976_02195 [candidate division WWE3 bacterium RIFCSPLOWO2_01_FULL_41_9]|uniref:histidine kinase n=1 Tax=candidate division WWE3 bacterium RIFCSPLOWO2_01_FULL_41_9 TaxID=1802626 RepID=A0A1F4VKC1_UNCKA|nr:MAG: hypothetical protein A2976_02195 [candidate division WWE3 bacterium RIFCSPLOWO2_01_FULL_41_9]